jgi:hypothetical protein
LRRGGRAFKGLQERLPKVSVVAYLQPLWRLQIEPLGKGAPAFLWDVGKSCQRLGHPRDQLIHGSGRRIAADIVLDLVQSQRVDDRPHVIQAQSQQTRPCRRGEKHADQPPARCADDRGLLDAEMVEQGNGVLRLLRNGVGFWPRPLRSAAPAIVGANEAYVAQMRSEEVEVGRIAGQAGEAKDRKACALVAKGEAGAIPGSKSLECHRAILCDTPRVPCRAGRGKAPLRCGCPFSAAYGSSAARCLRFSGCGMPRT